MDIGWDGAGDALREEARAAPIMALERLSPVLHGISFIITQIIRRKAGAALST